MVTGRIFRQINLLLIVACIALFWSPLQAYPILDEAPIIDINGTEEVCLDLPDDCLENLPASVFIHPEYERVARHVQFRIEDKKVYFCFVVDGVFGLKTRTGPVLVRRIQFKHQAKIQYVPSPGTAVKTLFAAGSFNQWKDGVTPLLWQPKLSCYEVELQLPRGFYEYKLVLNGKWMINPYQKRRRDDGYGGMNSVLACGDRPDVPRLIPEARIVDGNQVVFTYACSDERPVMAYLQCKNHLYSAESVRGNIQFTIPKSECSGYFFLRYFDQSLTFGSPILWFEEINENTNPMSEVLYFLMVDRFANGDSKNDRPVIHDKLADIANFKGGDLAGVKQMVDAAYFQKLGVTMIWFSPLTPVADGAWKDALPPERYYSGYHGYWPLAMQGVEKRYGTNEELQDLIATCHKSGIKTMVDLVFNHLHSESPEYKNHSDWFTKLDLADGTKNIRRFDEHPWTTWFDSFLPSFDYDNPAVRQKMIDQGIEYLDFFGFDGIRLDAVKHIPLQFVRELRQKLENRQNLYLIGETLSDRPTISRYIGEKLLDGQFDFPLYHTIVDVLGRGRSDMNYLLEEIDRSGEEYPACALMSNLLGNHDFPRFLAYADGDIPEDQDGREIGWNAPPVVNNPLAYRKLLLAYAFLFTIRGIPLIYYGDEVGMTGGGDPDNRRFFPDLEKIGSTGETLLKELSKLSGIRKSHPSLYCGALVPILSGMEHLVYARVNFNDDRLLVVLVRDLQSELHVDVPSWFGDMKELRDLISGKKYSVKDGMIRLPVQPWQYFILSEETNKTDLIEQH